MPSRLKEGRKTRPIASAKCRWTPTYPEPTPDPATLATVGFAAALGCSLDVAPCAVHIHKMASPLAGVLINVDSMARAAGDRSRAEGDRLRALVMAAAEPELPARIMMHRVLQRAAAAAACYFDLALLPW